MIYRLNWTDGIGGHVFNDTYPDGRQFIDEALKPVIVGTSNYEAVNYDEEMGDYFITIAGEVFTMSEEQEAATRDACIAWTDPNAPDAVALLETAKYKKRSEITATFDARVSSIDPTALPHEMVSWRKQETEARAWDADNNAVTPMIDILLVERDLGETKQQLVDKIIANADAYLTAYAGYLGRYQKALRLLEAATTELEINGIEF